MWSFKKPALALKVIHDRNCPLAELVCQPPPVNLYPDAALWLSRLLQMEIQASRPGPTNTQLISENKSALLQQTIDMVTSTKSIHQFLHLPPLLFAQYTRREGHQTPAATLAG